MVCLTWDMMGRKSWGRGNVLKHSTLSLYLTLTFALGCGLLSLDKPKTVYDNAPKPEGEARGKKVGELPGYSHCSHTFCLILPQSSRMFLPLRMRGYHRHAPPFCLFLTLFLNIYMYMCACVPIDWTSLKQARLAFTTEPRPQLLTGEF